MFAAEDFKQYRQKFGFSSQTNFKNFLSAKDVVPAIDFDYIKLLNERLYQIIKNLSFVVADQIKVDNLNSFGRKYIDEPFDIIKKNNILPRLNNLGRRPEQVYFSWMRGFVISNYFTKALSLIFEVDKTKIKPVGSDDLRKINSFKKTPKADLEIKFENNKRVKVEMQSGFSGINDIKQHKVLEAKKAFELEGIETILIHIDLYNGQTAFLKLNQISENNINWITRQQMEGQTVFNIDQNYFVWKITEPPIKYKEIEFD